MGHIKKYIYIGITLISMGWKAQISYLGTSAVLSYLAQITQYASRFGVVWLMMQTVGGLAGYNMWEILIIYSIELLSYALANSFLQPFWKMRDLVLGGELDLYLIRPINPLFFIMLKGFVPGYTAHIVLSLGVISLCSIQLCLFDSLRFWVLLFVTVAFASGIQLGLRCIPAFLTFWIGNVDKIHWAVSQIRSFVQYPLSIYPQIIQLICIFVVPYAFVSYFPSFLFLDKTSPATSLVIFIICGVVSIILVAITIIMWTYGLRRYESGNG